MIYNFISSILDKFTNDDMRVIIFSCFIESLILMYDIYIHQRSEKK